MTQATQATHTTEPQRLDTHEMQRSKDSFESSFEVNTTQELEVQEARWLKVALAVTSERVCVALIVLGWLMVIFAPELKQAIDQRYPERRAQLRARVSAELEREMGLPPGSLSPASNLDAHAHVKVEGRLKAHPTLKGSRQRSLRPAGGGEHSYARHNLSLSSSARAHSPRTKEGASARRVGVEVGRHHTDAVVNAFIAVVDEGP